MSVLCKSQRPRSLIFGGCVTLWFTFLASRGRCAHLPACWWRCPQAPGTDGAETAPSVKPPLASAVRHGRGEYTRRKLRIRVRRVRRFSPVAEVRRSACPRCFSHGAARSFPHAPHGSPDTAFAFPRREWRTPAGAIAWTAAS